MKNEILRLQNICFIENSNDIVTDGNIHLFKGEIVGIVGKNHSGKSALLGAATGEFPCKSGEIWINEHKSRIHSIIQARKEGIFLIKDESSLINEFTIKDTMKLNFAFVNNKISYRRYIRKCKEILEGLEVKENHDMYISKLNFHKRVLVEIAQALICDVRILVFDNVISLLSEQALLQLQNILKKLCDKEISIVLIENHIDSIKEYIDRLYTMRKGKVIAELDKDEMDEELILSLLEGEKFVPNPGKLQRIDDVDYSKVMMKFERIRTKNLIIKDVNFELYANETLGIWNKGRHSGQAIINILEGKCKLDSGIIRVESNIFDNAKKDNIRRHRVLVIPEENKFCSNMDIGENISLSALSQKAYGGVIKKEGELKFLVNELCTEYLMDEEYHIFPNQSLSDNILIQKKVSLCRAIAAGAKIIVYSNPDLNLDIRGKENLKQDILRTQKKKISQIIISANLDYFYPICNRIIKIDNGRTVE